MDINSIPRNRLVLIGAAALLVLVLVVLLMFFSKNPSTGPTVNLKMWGSDPKESLAGVFAAYKVSRPNVNIEYTVVTDNYEDELVNAFATGKGPDVFMLGNHDVRKYSRLISPATSTVFRPDQLDPLFPQAVKDDFVYKGQVYALPLYMDTLALVYNRDKFDQAGIPTPPATWDEVLEDIPKLRSENAQGQLTASAIAMGGTENTVVHASDILSLLMLQNGSAMNSSDGQAVFGSANSDKAAEAFHFYLDFANAGSSAYTWNEGRPRSFESFFANTTAMVLATREDVKSFENKSPFLRYGVAPVPQVADGKVINYPEYKGLSAWVGGKNAAWSWDFIIFAATNEGAAEAYANAIDRPAALRNIIAKQAKNSDMAIFAKQALTARSWSIADYDKMKEIMSRAIERALKGEAEPEAALSAAQSELNKIR